MDTTFFLQLIIFAFTLWFGLYLQALDPRKPGLRYAGLGLLSYATGLVFVIALEHWPDAAPDLESWHTLVVVLPSLFWTAAAFHLLPDVSPWRVDVSVLIGLVLLALLSLAAATIDADAARIVIGAVPFALAAAALIRIWRAFSDGLPRPPLVILFTATIFFGLGIGALIVPIGINSTLLLLALSADLLLLGVAIGILDAYDEGRSLLPDALRSLLTAGALVALFAGQTALMLHIAGAEVRLRVVLLLSLTVSAVVLATLADWFQRGLDRVLFSGQPDLQDQRDALRAINRALPQTRPAVDFTRMPPADFDRITRRALSHYNDLHKLAANPLTQHTLIDAYLQRAGKPNTQIERVTALKALLRACIASLKPASDESFAPSDEWRFYNALYFPYVAGLKPYSRRTIHDELPADERQALDWFQVHVPERTLYNWQTTAAGLVAQQIRDMDPDDLHRLVDSA